MFARLIFLFIVLTVYAPVYSQDTSIGQRIKAVIFAVIKAFKCIVECLLSENFKLTLIGNTKISCNIERMKIFTDNISAKAVYCRKREYDAPG